MIKHTQTISRQFAVELFECVWPFSEIGAERVKTNETCSLEKTKFIKRDISSENINTFKFLLENIKWDNILPANSPDKAYETFYFTFSDLYDTAFPKMKLKLKLNVYNLPG